MSQLRTLLTISSPKQESVFSILGRMELLLDYFKVQPRYVGLVPFLQTYYWVTKAVAQRNFSKTTAYHNAAALEQLDIHFANLYFQPLLKHLAGQTTGLAPWQTYFQYCQSDQRNAFVELLLGINAHINGDLPICLASLRYQEQKDFQVINRILSDLIPQVMSFLTLHYHSVLALGGLVLPQFTHEEFYRLIVRWRKQAWTNALLITPAQLTRQRRSIHQQTEQVAERVIELFKNPEHFLLHRTELDTLSIVLSR